MPFQLIHTMCFFLKFIVLPCQRLQPKEANRETRKRQRTETRKCVEVGDRWGLTRRRLNAKRVYTLEVDEHTTRKVTGSAGLGDKLKLNGSSHRRRKEKLNENVESNRALKGFLELNFQSAASSSTPFPTADWITIISYAHLTQFLTFSPTSKESPTADLSSLMLQMPLRLFMLRADLSARRRKKWRKLFGCWKFFVSLFFG